MRVIIENREIESNKTYLNSSPKLLRYIWFEGGRKQIYVDCISYFIEDNAIVQKEKVDYLCDKLVAI